MCASHVYVMQTEDDRGAAIDHCCDLLAPLANNVFWPVSTSAVWPTQTIKDMPTVILALFFHYGSGTAGALITCVGLLREWMGTDSTTGPKQEPQGFSMSWLLTVSIGRESDFLYFCLFIVISSHLLAHFAFPNFPSDRLFLLFWDVLSCFLIFCSFVLLTREAIGILKCPFQFTNPISELKTS